MADEPNDTECLRRLRRERIAAQRARHEAENAVYTVNLTTALESTIFALHGVNWHRVSDEIVERTKRWLLANVEHIECGGAPWFHQEELVEAVRRAQRPVIDLSPSAADQTAASRNPPSRLKPFWKTAEPIIMGWLNDDGCPASGDGEQAKIERRVAELLENRGWVATSSTVRTHVKNCIARHRAQCAV